MTSAAPVLPFVQGAIRALLVHAPAFTAVLPADRVVTRAPTLVTSPYAVIKAPPAVPIDVSAGMWSPLVQVEGCSPPGLADDPEVVAWRIAATAAAVLARARNVAYESMRYSARVTDGPLSDVDTSRGAASPIYRALIRAELRVHTR